ncbi:MAG: M20/M25/M40 family metallo-hydrolase, partial [Ardenticatenaceae bacterium]
MSAFAALWGSGAAERGCGWLAANADRTEREAVAIQQIPAPPFAEEARACYVRERFESLGLLDLSMDESGNVFGRVAGRGVPFEPGPAMLVTAHLDTVFGPETDLTIRHTGDRLYGPGIGDNSLGVAALLAHAAWFQREQPRRDIWFAANVGEEGLGNLRGMWALMQRLQSRIGAVVVLEGGAFGVVIHRGTGIERRRLTVETEGGHAWSDFGAASAVHELCHIGSLIASLEIPASPRTTYNLGAIQGGASINTIASEASALLDLRSEDPAALAQLSESIDGILAGARRDRVTVRSEEIGARPAGAIPANHPLVEAAVESLRWVGCEKASLRAASTDANVPLSLGIPSVCIGVAVGQNAHRIDEYIELDSLRSGLKHTFL